MNLRWSGWGGRVGLYFLAGLLLFVADEVGGDGEAGEDVGGEEGEGGGNGHDGEELEEVVGNGLDAGKSPHELAHDGDVAEVDAEREVGGEGYEALQFTPPPIAAKLQRLRALKMATVRMATKMERYQKME